VAALDITRIALISVEVEVRKRSDRWTYRSIKHTWT